MTGELTVNIPWTSANESGALKGTSYGRTIAQGMIGKMSWERYYSTLKMEI